MTVPVDLRQRQGSIFIDYVDGDGKAAEIRLIGVTFFLRNYESQNDNGVGSIKWVEITVADCEVKVA